MQRQNAQQAVVIVQIEDALHLRYKAREVAVRKHHALRSACSSRREDERSERIRRYFVRQSLYALKLYGFVLAQRPHEKAISSPLCLMPATALPDRKVCCRRD